MNKRILTHGIAVATLTAGFALASTVPAMASHGGGGKERTGSCSQGAQWKLKAKTDDGGLQVEGEVDTNQSGQTFAWKIIDNGQVQAKGSSTTGGASGSFSVERRIPNQQGTDKLVFKAKNAANGETCTGRLSF